MVSNLNLIELGVLLIFLGMLLIFFGAFKSAYDSKAKADVAFVGFIGPLPIGFGTDKRLVIFSFLILVVMLLYIFMVMRSG